MLQPAEPEQNAFMTVLVFACREIRQDEMLSFCEHEVVTGFLYHGESSFRIPNTAAHEDVSRNPPDRWIKTPFRCRT